MIGITKAEKELVEKRFPNAHIVRTMKQRSKRHHYFCEESYGVMRLLEQIRSAQGAAKVVDARGNKSKKW